MDWQLPSDSVPSALVSEALTASLRGTPPVTGAWRDGDPLGQRKFCQVGPMGFEMGGALPHVRIAYEVFGELSPAADNAILVFHALTGDSHAAGPAGSGHPTGGWWHGVIGPGLALDTNRYAVIVPNILGGCQGSTGPASVAPRRSGVGFSLPLSDHQGSGGGSRAPRQRTRYRRLSLGARWLNGRNARSRVGSHVPRANEDPGPNSDLR